MTFDGESDAHIVRGLVAIVLSIFSGKRASEIVATDALDLFGRMGLIEFLTAPNRKSDEFLQALQRLREQAWYLHREDQRLFVKETENLSRQIERNAKEVPQPKIDQALINRLTGILQPERRLARRVAVSGTGAVRHGTCGSVFRP